MRSQVSIILIVSKVTCHPDFFQLVNLLPEFIYSPNGRKLAHGEGGGGLEKFYFSYIFSSNPNRTHSLILSSSRGPLLPIRTPFLSPHFYRPAAGPWGLEKPTPHHLVIVVTPLYEFCFFFLSKKHARWLASESGRTSTGFFYYMHVE